MIKNEILRHFLVEGPCSVRNLVRLTGKSDSGIRKVLAENTDIVQCRKDSTGTNVFWIDPERVLPTAEQQEVTETVASEPSAAPEVQSTTSETDPAQIGLKPGRKALGAGKRLFPADANNPRRKGSHGFHSLQVVIDNPGINHEDYLTMGGRNNDLRWDITHGNVLVEG